MSNQDLTPKCRDCNQYMFEVGGIGKTVSNYKSVDTHGMIDEIGICEMFLYQCPECKGVRLSPKVK